MYGIVKVQVFNESEFRLVYYPYIGCHYSNNNGHFSIKGLNGESVKRITQYLHGKPVCKNNKSEKSQVNPLPLTTSITDIGKG